MRSEWEESRSKVELVKIAIFLGHLACIFVAPSFVGIFFLHLIFF